MTNVLRVRFRVDFGHRCSVGVGKIELLEGIARTGSLSQAAREMGMSYRRAWLLLEDMNLSFDAPIARATVGGRGGGGVVLTPLGADLVAAYRLVASEVQTLAATRLTELARRVASKPHDRVVRASRLKRSSAPAKAVASSRRRAGRASSGR
jgi:molybdate transport system regulatory protein